MAFLADGDEQIWRRRARYAWLFLLTLAVLWFFFLGDHWHLVEIATSGGTLRVVSNRSKFQISLPGQTNNSASMHHLFGYDGIRLQGIGRISPWRIEGVGITRSTQQIQLPSDVKRIVFVINDIEFILDGQEVRVAGHRWTLTPGSTLEIDVNRIP